MTSIQSGGVPADVIASLRENPILATVSEEALAKIAELVAAETRQQVARALREVELFQGLPAEDLERIQEIAEPLMLGEDAKLFDEGEAGDRFYVVVRGAVELSRGGEGDGERVGVLRTGQALGEMALLSDAPRAVSARSVEQSYVVGIARDAFLDVLGADSMASRLLRNLSRAMWASPARPAPAPTASVDQGSPSKDTPREALTEYNRMVRSRMLPRGLPKVAGYEVAATSVADEGGEGGAVWDWLLLSDGRMALVVMKSDQPSLSSAHRLLSVRGLLRDFAEDPIADVGALLARVNRGLRAAWVDGVSGSVSCGLLALSEDYVDWVSAGGVAGTIVRADGRRGDDLVPETPSLGLFDEVEYRPVRVRLKAGDHVLVFADGPGHSVIEGRRLLSTGRAFPDAGARLDAVVERVRKAGDGAADVTAALVTRGGAAKGEGNDAIARAAAAYDAAMEEEESAGASS